MRATRVWMMAAVGSLALTGCGIGHAADAGPAGARNFAVGGFTRVEVAGPYKVRIVTGGAPMVTARGGQAALDKMVVEVKGGTLQIRPEKGGWLKGGWGMWGGKKGERIAVEVRVPMVESVAIAGSGDVSVDRITGTKFEGEIAGSGRLDLPAVDVGELGLEIAGSGNFKAVGKATNVRYEIAGSGDIDAGGVQAQNASAEITGSGNIAAHASGTARLEITGSGDINLTGGAKCQNEKTGSGTIRCS